MDIVFLAVLVVVIVVVVPVWLARRARRTPDLPVSPGVHPQALPRTEAGTDRDAIEAYTKFRTEQRQQASEETAAEREREEHRQAQRQRNHEFVIAVLRSEGIAQHPMYAYVGYRAKKFQRPAGPIFHYLGPGWLVSNVAQFDGEDFYEMLTADGVAYKTAHGTVAAVVPENEPDADGIDHGRGFRVEPSGGFHNDYTAEQLAALAASAVDLNKEYQQ